MQREIEEAERAEKEAVAATNRAQEAVCRAKRGADSGAAPTPPPQTHEQGLNSRSNRPGDAAFFEGSVVCRASSPREELSCELADSVVAKASALLASVRKASLHPSELLSVDRAWSEMDHNTYQGQKRAAPTFVSVKGRRMAHDDAWDTDFVADPGRGAGGTPP